MPSSERPEKHLKAIVNEFVARLVKVSLMGRRKVEMMQRMWMASAMAILVAGAGKFSLAPGKIKNW